MTDTPKNREELDRMLEYQIDAAVKVKVHSDGDVTTKVNVPQFRAALESHGVRLVPVEATKEMASEAEAEFQNHVEWRDPKLGCSCLWEAMLSASPFAPDDKP